MGSSNGAGMNTDDDDYRDFFEAELSEADWNFLDPFQERIHNLVSPATSIMNVLFFAATIWACRDAISNGLVAALALITAFVVITRPTGIIRKIGIATGAERIAVQAMIGAIAMATVIGLPLAHGLTKGVVPGALMLLMVLGGAISYAHTPTARRIFLALSTGIFIVCLLANGASAAAQMAAILPVVAATAVPICNSFFTNFASRFLRERDLSAASETVRLLLHDYESQSSDWLWEVDGHGRFINHSQRSIEAIGRTAEEMETVRGLDIYHREADREKIAAAIASGQPFRSIEVAIMVGEEERFWSISGRPVFGEDGKFAGARGVASDITDAKRAEARIAYMARYDGLTDLPNRTMFAETLARALVRRREGTLLSVLYLDLDHFKTINDTLGHGTGDLVLKEAAHRIERCLGVHDVVSRQGGDEFAILLPDPGSRSRAETVAETIIAAIEEPMMADGHQVNIGASIGIACVPGHANEAEELIKHADLALYHAKQAGRGRYAHFLIDMHEEMQTRRQIEVDLRKAIAGDQLELHYQPLINLKSGKPVGYEALLRWNHPERGRVMPDDFIPVAEETGLIVSLGEWVIRNALEEVRRWPEELSVSVNLSPAQLGSSRLVPTVVNALASTGVSASRLELEITETVLMNDSAANLQVLHQLRALGVRIALDDFGTGYSSLNYLRTFPFDKIKIDRSFINEVDTRPDNKAIVKAVTGLADSLGMVTTAEGVERGEQLDQLRSDGCTEVQGYYFSRPVPAAQLPSRMSEAEPVGTAPATLIPRRVESRSKRRRAARG
jgi:diguanylate cyclase (GGDEF)-like protein/PAS domain S-box-containing protein